jgi:uncharacterized protein
MALPVSVAWRRVDLDHGIGVARVSAISEGFAAEGCDLSVDGERLWWATWGVDVDGAWRTRSFAAAVGGASDERDLTLVADRSGSWTRDGEPAPELEGCTDVDIVSTPFTNTLPIRRLGLAVGESADIRAAWVDVPSLELSVSNQRYTRLEPDEGMDRYQFQALDSGHTYVLTVDQDGLVIDYEQFAQRIAPRRDP